MHGGTVDRVTKTGGIRLQPAAVDVQTYLLFERPLRITDLIDELSNPDLGLVDLFQKFARAWGIFFQFTFLDTDRILNKFL